MPKPSFWAQLWAAFSQVSHLTSGFPVSQSSFSRLNDGRCCQSIYQPLRCTARHGSEQIPSVIEGNFGKDAVLPGKQKTAVTWLSWRAPGRRCKTRAVPSASIWKAIPEKRKAREPLRTGCTATAVSLDNALLNLVLRFHPELQRWSPKVQTNSH